jgi:leukotriene-A4 hydrolase
LHLMELFLDKAQLQELDAKFKLSDTGNAEILAVWLGFAVQHHYEPAYPALERFLNRVGRRKFLTPLYKMLKKQDAAWAKRIYEQARPNYHAVATSTLDKLLLQ